MENVYYTLVGILAMVGIGLVLIGLYKAVIFLGDTIDDWWHDRKVLKTSWVPQIVWAEDGGTGRIVTEKPISPIQLRALQGLSPFHKHDYKLIRARHTLYEFVCRKDGCGETVEIPRTYFWDGGEDTQQLYQEALRAFNNYRSPSSREWVDL